MKKILFATTLLLCVVSNSTQAQLKWGVKAGLNMSSISLKDASANLVLLIVMVSL